MENTKTSASLLLTSLNGNQQISLSSKTYWTVGRYQDNDIVIADHTISRNHAILQATETGEFLLIDLGSRNGTFVNGRRVSIPVLLKNRDQITFGKTEAKFYASEHEGPPSGIFLRSAHETQTSALHERRLMSVMVADMRNFTGLTRQLDETMLSILIGNWFRQAGDILRDAGSWVDKYIGDAVMAIWFHAQDDVTPEDILRIFQAINRLNQSTTKLSQQYPVPFPLRIGVGVNTGYAMVGNTGSGDHPDYTAIGDTVNAAFRLESITKTAGFDVAIGEKTYSYLANFQELAQFFRPYETELKGYDKPALTYGLNFEQLDPFIRRNQSMTTLS
ncbi:adenylate/guanylate cyclase domain-containing protein [Synechocystis sp. LKSZ1]|uniref:adenylate/guanylate cyclase domain-containing protein n=1 Tax=Synechocystis sp. LKSZ1 TaxID=3144951 RepID=UPI00336C2C99